MFLLAVNALNAITSRLTYEDIWKTHFLLIDKMNLQNPDNAFSAVAVQNGLDSTNNLVSNINGHFCSAGGRESYIFTLLSGLDIQSGGSTGMHKMVYFKTR